MRQAAFIVRRLREIAFPQPLFPRLGNSMALTPSTMIEVKRTKGKGRGVYARVFISEGTVFERAPLLVMPAKEALSEDSNVLPAYVFEYGKKKVALALGFGSLYNHSYQPNARYDDATGQVKEYRALRDIQAGEEITINYNGAEDVLDPVDFPVVD
jgi:SET domain-containing protein